MSDNNAQRNRDLMLRKRAPRAKPRGLSKTFSSSKATGLVNTHSKRLAVSSVQTPPSSLMDQEDHAVKLYRTSRYERVLMVKEGLPAKYVKVLSEMLSMPIEKFYRTTGLARPTIDRKIRNSKVLNQDESERVMGIARLVGQAQNLVDESGDQRDFDAGRWVGAWLQQPLPALRGKSPGEFMDTVDGRSLVSDLLSQQQSGAYG